MMSRCPDSKRPGQCRVRDPPKDAVVFIREEVTAQVQDHRAGHRHHHAGQQHAPQTIEAEGHEVLDHLEAGGKARTDQ